MCQKKEGRWSSSSDFVLGRREKARPRAFTCEQHQPRSHSVRKLEYPEGKLPVQASLSYTALHCHAPWVGKVIDHVCELVNGQGELCTETSQQVIVGFSLSRPSTMHDAARVRGCHHLDMQQNIRRLAASQPSIHELLIMGNCSESCGEHAARRAYRVAAAGVIYDSGHCRKGTERSRLRS